MNLIKTIFLVLLISLGQSLQAQTIPSWKATTLAEYITKSDSVLVINFWATFCKPCIEEIPYFESAVKKYEDKKVKLVLVSLDLKDQYPKSIKSFVDENKYSSKVVWLNETNADYFCPIVDKTWSGGIPATLIINPNTGYRKFFEDQLKPEEIESEIEKAIQLKIN